MTQPEPKRDDIWEDTYDKVTVVVLHATDSHVQVQRSDGGVGRYPRPDFLSGGRFVVSPVEGS